LPDEGDDAVHEQSLMNDLMRKIRAVAQQQGAGRITGVSVRIGALAHMSAEHFREHFAHASAGGPADGARVDVVLQNDPSDPDAQSVLLESVEVEVAE
jgi:hydrogenase nickel incorporation protein HypA/HybF